MDDVGYLQHQRQIVLDEHGRDPERPDVLQRRARTAISASSSPDAASSSRMTPEFLASARPTSSSRVAERQMHRRSLARSLIPSWSRTASEASRSARARLRALRRHQRRLGDRAGSRPGIGLRR